MTDRTHAPTISDVARIAGAGKTSVSRYLNGETAALSPDLHERIAKAIAELAYRPNQMARGLKRGRTRLIGIMVADLQNPYSVEVIEGIEAACRQIGLMPMICNAGNELEVESRYLDLLRTYRAEGLIVNPVGLPESTLHSIANGEVPMVFLDRTVAGIECDSVALNNHAATHAIVDHLHDNDFENIYFVCESYENVSSRRERVTAFLAGAKQRGRYAEVIVIDLSDPMSIDAALATIAHAARGSEIVHEYDKGTQAPAKKRCALIAANGQTMLALSIAMTRIPLENVGMATFDDPEWVALTKPGVTTLRQPTFDIGKTAVQFLNERIDGSKEAPRRRMFDATLIARPSTQRIPSM